MPSAVCGEREASPFRRLQDCWLWWSFRHASAGTMAVTLEEAAHARISKARSAAMHRCAHLARAPARLCERERGEGVVEVNFGMPPSSPQKDPLCYPMPTIISPSSPRRRLHAMVSSPTCGPMHALHPGVGERLLRRHCQKLGTNNCKGRSSPHRHRWGLLRCRLPRQGDHQMWGIRST